MFKEAKRLIGYVGFGEMSQKPQFNQRKLKGVLEEGVKKITVIIINARKNCKWNT